MESELEELKNTLDGYHIPISMEWLESCVEWCKSELPGNYSSKELYRAVYQQWLLLDLRVVEIRSLPSNLSSEKRYNLTGIFYLQVMKVLDISKPKLWQLQRIRNNVAKNTELEKDFGKRVLQLTLTDGVEEVEAMEFKPIPCLSINLKPGCKLSITGPVMVRHGRLMLEPCNVKLLDGYVEELLITNAAENVLARALGLEENPNPKVFDEKILDVTEVNSVTQSRDPAPQQTTRSNQCNENQLTNRSVPSNTVSTNSDSGRGTNISNITSGTFQNKRTNTSIETDFVIDDDLLRELEEDLEEPSGQYVNKPSVNTAPKKSNIRNETAFSSVQKAGPSRINTKRRSSSPDLFDEMDLDDELLRHLDQLDSASADSPKPQNVNKPNDDVILLDDSFDDIDIDAHLDRIDEEMSKLPSSTQVNRATKSTSNTPKKLAQSKLNFGSLAATKNLPGVSKSSTLVKNVDSESSSRLKLEADRSTDVSESLNYESSANYGGLPKIKVLSIEKLKSLMPNVGHGKFKIKGKFKEVKEKLTTTETDIYMVIVIKDDSGEMTVQIDSSLVEKLADITLGRLKELRELTITSQHKEAKKEIFEALGRLHNKLLKLDNIMDIQITRGQKYPVIMNVMDKQST